VVSRTISAIENVLVGGSAVDVCLCTLSEPLAKSEVTPFAYMNLGSETYYIGKEVVVFGTSARAGYGKISTYLTVNANVGAATRSFRIDYKKTADSTTTIDDAYGEGGDSGSPSFIVTDGRPGLVGINFAVSGDTTYNYLYCSSIPYYVTALNTLMEPTGYRMIPFTPPTPILGTLRVKEPETFVAGQQAVCQFGLKNYASGVAGNVTMTLTFPSGAAPDSISAPGWVVESVGTDEWRFRKASIASMVTATATATWASFPERASLYVKTTYGADGATEKTFYSDLAPVTSYAEWARFFADPDPVGDSDGDGIGNLLEYAFGGDPHAASWKTVAGNTLMPSIVSEDGQVTLAFPVRSDSALTYTVEYSDTMEEGVWTTEPPVPVTTTTAAFDPAVESYSLRTISYSLGEMPHIFSRVRVTLPDSE